MRILSSFAILTLAFSAISSDEFQPKEEKTELKSSIAPIGFDSNDRIQLIVSGQFSNTCYQVGPHKAVVEDGKIIVEQKAYVYNGLCLQVTVPFNHVVELDELLDQGDYEIVDKTSGRKLGVLPVKEAKAGTPGPGSDEKAYAPISDAFVVKDGASGGHAVILRGVFTNSCFQFEDIERHPYRDQVVVLPVIKKVEKNNKNEKDKCRDGRFPFEERRLLPRVKTASYLLHVRSMNGQGINKVVDGLAN